MKTLPFITLLLLAPAAHADPARIMSTDMTNEAGQWSVSVTLEHGDTGWDDYADGWRIEDVDGTILGTRILQHPHVNEQPFTRSLYGVDIPDDLTTIFIRASTNMTGWDTARIEVLLP